MTPMSKERLNEIKDVFVREHLPIRFAGLIDELFDEIRRLQSELAEQRKEIEATRERNNRLAHTMSEMVDAIDRKDKEIEELRAQVEGKWITTKPDFPCVVITRDKFFSHFRYDVWILQMIDGYDEYNNLCQYLGWLNNQGEEYGSIEDFQAAEYMIIEKSHPSKQ